MKQIIKFKIEITIFILFFITRFLFLQISEFNNFELQLDSYWYTKQSDEVLRGNFNLIQPLFITAPFFTYFQALIKFIFSSYWMGVLEILQISISSIAGIFFCKLSFQLFKKKQTAILSTILFCFYPITLWWVGSFTQEIWFQSFLIIFFYYFMKSLDKNSLKLLIVSAIFFSLTFLTKSHILIFSIFIPIIILLKKNLLFFKKLKFIFAFIIISLVSTLPYGIYNLIVNKTYAISSSGSGGSFLVGNNEEAYLNFIKLDEITPEQKKRFSHVMFTIFDEVKPKLKNKTQPEVQKIYFSEGLKWIKQNPAKAIELKINHAKSFFTPGISSYWHSYERWLAALIFSGPLYFFAYISIVYHLISKFKENFWILGLIISMFAFTIIFYYSGRFIVITLEPYYIIFASDLLVRTWNKFIRS
jgi:hypothetical protein